MTYALDPELAPVLAALAAPDAPVAARGDWQTLRALGEATQALLASRVPAVSGVATTDYRISTDDGATITCRWYSQGTAGPGSAVVYAHGGGMVMGTLDLYDKLLSWYVDQTGVPFLSVGYRRAPDEASGTTLAEDVFAGVRWLVEQADALGIDAARIAVMGDSGGGALAAGAAILARDRGVALARQILVYPMLDDRTQSPDAARGDWLTWTYDNNVTAWSAVLGDAMGTEAVSPIAAPARLEVLSDLAPAYLDVGDLDLFRDEGIAYALRLAAHGVPIELHVHPGVPHGWERFAPAARSAQRAMADRFRVIATL